jgi:hypothetical protein
MTAGAKGRSQRSPTPGYASSAIQPGYARLGREPASGSTPDSLRRSGIGKRVRGQVAIGNPRDAPGQRAIGLKKLFDGIPGRLIRNEQSDGQWGIVGAADKILQTRQVAFGGVFVIVSCRARRSASRRTSRCRRMSILFWFEDTALNRSNRHACLTRLRLFMGISDGLKLLACQHRRNC